MAKLTNAQLNALVARLENEIKLLKDEKAADNKLAKETTGCDTWRLAYHMCAQELINAKGEKTETKTNSNIVTVPEEKKVEVMRWLMRIVGYEPQNVPDAFFVEFDIWTNTDRNWWAFTPKSGGLSNLKSAFVKGFNKARFDKQVPGNYYKNTGAWINVQVKR